ncbi:MAG TPA: hypothetical protein VF491_17510 [Vicinamibacterales bacterium]
MNILVAGLGKGSWEMRGQQLGAAIGARVTSTPTAADWQWAQVAILVKRAAFHLAAPARQAGVPIIWDALDFWSQPRENWMSAHAAHQLLGATIAEIRPALTICATEAMARACDGAYLPHHSWAGLEPQPAREQMGVVAYEGNPAYLGRWHDELSRACRSRGWSFVVNPADIRTVDLFVAFRDGQWDGYPCREWKSGVKVSNAIAAGRPIIGQTSAALREMAPPHTIVESPTELDAALDAWTPHAARAAAVDVCRLKAPALRLSAIVAQYRDVLQQVEASCAA